MAGDWIKMRGNLWDDPRVSKLCDITGATEAPIVGALYWLWATADQHTENGILPGLTLRQIDRKTSVPGFAEALCSIGWLSDHADGVRIERFEEHNGTSAKRRCVDAQRKAGSRTPSGEDADTTRTDSGQKTPNLGAREREEKRKNTPPTPTGEFPGFAAFWLAWPTGDRKQAKGKCLEAWKKAGAEPHAALVLAHVERMKASPLWTKDGGQFVPAPLVYLNQRRWEGAEDAGDQRDLGGGFI